MTVVVIKVFVTVVVANIIRIKEKINKLIKLIREKVDFHHKSM